MNTPYSTWKTQHTVKAADNAWESKLPTMTDMGDGGRIDRLHRAAGTPQLANSPARGAHPVQRVAWEEGSKGQVGVKRDNRVAMQSGQNAVPQSANLQQRVEANRQAVNNRPAAPARSAPYQFTEPAQGQAPRSSAPYKFTDPSPANSPRATGSFQFSEPGKAQPSSRPAAAPSALQGQHQQGYQNLLAENAQRASVKQRVSGMAPLQDIDRARTTLPNAHPTTALGDLNHTPHTGPSSLYNAKLKIDNERGYKNLLSQNAAPKPQYSLNASAVGSKVAPPTNLGGGKAVDTRLERMRPVAPGQAIPTPQAGGDVMKSRLSPLKPPTPGQTSSLLHPKQVAMLDNARKVVKQTGGISTQMRPPVAALNPTPSVGGGKALAGTMGNVTRRLQAMKPVGSVASGVASAASPIMRKLPLLGTMAAAAGGVYKGMKMMNKGNQIGSAVGKGLMGLGRGGLIGGGLALGGGLMAAGALSRPDANGRSVM